MEGSSDVSIEKRHYTSDQDLIKGNNSKSWGKCRIYYSTAEINTKIIDGHFKFIILNHQVYARNKEYTRSESGAKKKHVRLDLEQKDNISMKSVLGF